MVEELNQMIINKANLFIQEDGSNILIDITKQPNDNIIYHLYESGEITHQKGGSAYGKRSEFTDYPSLCQFWYGVGSPFKFNKKMYVILPFDICIHFRNLMNEVTKPK